MPLRFPGVIPALLTPFDEHGAIDEEKLTRHTEKLIEAGVHGLVTVGTMGEAPSMSRSERREVTRAVVDQAVGRVPVIAGVSATSVDQVLAHCGDAEEAGAKGVMLLPPLLYEADYHELLEFYGAVDAGTELPIMLYNNPKASGAGDLSSDVIASLAGEIDGIAAVKECSGDARRIAALDGIDAEVLIGGDDWALEGFFAGSTGWVSGVANVAPALCVQLFEQCGRGEVESARQTYRALLPLSRLDMRIKLVQYFKAAMRIQGNDFGSPRSPRLELTSDELAEVVAAVDALQGATSGAVAG